MPDSYTTKKITGLTAKTTADDSDLYVLGNAGTATMRKITFANIANAIRDKLNSLTFSSLATTDKTLPGAINEVKNTIGSLVASVSSSELSVACTTADTYYRVGSHSITLGAGTWIIIGKLQVRSGSASALLTYGVSPTSNFGGLGKVTVKTPSDNVTSARYGQVFFPVVLTESTTYYGWLASGGVGNNTCSAWEWLYAIRVK